jgi:hypothetical protein
MTARESAESRPIQLEVSGPGLKSRGSRSQCRAEKRTVTDVTRDRPSFRGRSPAIRPTATELILNPGLCQWQASVQTELSRGLNWPGRSGLTSRAREEGEQRFNNTVDDLEKVRSPAGPESARHPEHRPAKKSRPAINKKPTSQICTGINYILPKIFLFINSLSKQFLYRKWAVSLYVRIDINYKNKIQTII